MIKPVNVKPMSNYTLCVAFENGEKRIFDVKPYFEFPYFHPLKDERMFTKVFVKDAHVQWENNRDIAPHELYENSVPLSL